MKGKPSILIISYTVSVTTLLVFLAQITYKHYFDTVNLSGHPFVANGGTNVMSSSKVLRILAFDLTNLKEKSSQDGMLMKDDMEKLISTVDKQNKLSESMKQNLEVSLSSLKEQGETLKSQQKAVEELQHRVEEQGKVLEQKVQEALRGHRSDISQLKDDLSVRTTQEIENRRGVSNMPERYMGHGDPNRWRQRVFSHHGTYGFVPFSTYRVSPRQFVTPALASLTLHDVRHLEGCKWHGRDGHVVEGDFEFRYPKEHHYTKYETVVAICTLHEDSGETGGFLEAVVDFELVVLLHENELTTSDGSPPGYNPVAEDSLPYSLTLCSGPLHSALDSQTVWEWMEWNRVVVGVDQTILYNVGGVDATLLEKLSPYRQAGMLEVTDVGTVPYDVWYFAQSLLMHDCLYRNTWKSRWILFVDMDEYVEAVKPHSVSSLLKEHSDKAWLSHQVQWWSLEHCVPAEEKDSFAIERMVWHWSHIYCQAKERYPQVELCLSGAGHRKMFINPRKVKLVSIHDVLESTHEGLHLKVNTEMLHHHWQGLNTRGRKHSKSFFCKQEHKRDDNIEWWSKDLSVVKRAQSVRACQFGNSSCTDALRNY